MLAVRPEGVVNGAALASDAALMTASADGGHLRGQFSNVTSSSAGKGVVRYQW